MEMDTLRLELCAPLIYNKSLNPPPLRDGQNSGESGAVIEQLFCFELDSRQGLSIEPERGQFLGGLLFSGFKHQQDQDSPFSANALTETVQLPAGAYLFTQKREALGKEDIIDMAIEQQKDGLWERNKPQNVLYIRFLFEDEKHVTQIFRPIAV
jgi:hypothetical protein